MKNDIINVTKTYLPPIEEYITYLRGIWESNQLTNNGPLAQQLEEDLKSYLNVEHLFFVSNGTVALQIAIKALQKQGEIITTPYSYVATTSSIIWENCKPVFVDIDPDTLCINPDLIENAITPQTIAILPTHVYGFPCPVGKLENIAQKYGIKVIYDAAHTFGVNFKDIPLASYGDISILSFHATKIFHTVEGGAIITNDDALAHRISYMRNFGHKGQEDYWGLGINGKNTEFHAAMGLCIFPKISDIISARKKLSRVYHEHLKDSALRIPHPIPGTSYNFAYFPVIFPSEDVLLDTIKALQDHGVFPRRYFYP
jgi:dTDP-4-amino-4,6-dideoxygalactose transaminase